MVEEINIAEILDSSHSITENEKSRLRLLKEEYPWSSDIRIAYLKALKDTKDLSFTDELKNVALITNDRGQLYKTLYGESLRKTILKVEKEMDELPDVEGLIPANWKKVYSTDSAEEIEIDADVPSIQINPLSPLQETAEISENKNPVTEEIVNPKSELEKIEQEEIKVEEKEDLEINSATSSELNQLIISEAIDTSITLDVIEDINDTKAASNRVNEVETSVIKEPVSVSSDDFINWLISNAQAVSYPSFSSVSAENKKANIDSVIDKFIQNEPHISRGKSKEYSLENLAAESLVDNEEFVTETLAEIYASQGNNSKAKRAFQLLSLKYPEKSIYFAARIKRLGRKK